ncbi:MAG: hypothetical protein ACREGR_00940 [Minisyncoccia bacterium]
MDLLETARHHAGRSAALICIAWGGISGGVVFLGLLVTEFLFKISEGIMLSWLTLAAVLIFGGFLAAFATYFLARHSPIRVRKELENARDFAKLRLEDLEPKLADLLVRLENFDQEMELELLDLLRSKWQKGLIPKIGLLEKQLEFLKMFDAQASREMRLKNGELFRHVARQIREYEALLAEVRETPELEPPAELVRKLAKAMKGYVVFLRQSGEKLRDALGKDIRGTRALLAEAERLLSSSTH